MHWFKKFLRLAFRTPRGGSFGLAVAGAQSGALRNERPQLRALTSTPTARSVAPTPEPDRDAHGPDEVKRPQRGPAPAPAPANPRRARLVGVVAVTIIEAASIYAWLRLHVGGEPVWGLVALIVGEFVETAVLRRFVDRGGLKRWGPLPGRADRKHLRKVQRTVDAAGNAEIAIWVLWLICAYELGQPIAAAILLVTMHLKHHAETAAVCDIPYRKGLFGFTGLLGSALESGGAVVCLALIFEGHYALAAVAVGTGLFIEHWLLIGVLQWEIKTRDIRVPRDQRFKPPARRSATVSYVGSHFPRVWRVVQGIAPLARLLNRIAINRLINKVEPRPNPFSTLSPYTSWASLSERKYSGRYLAAVSPEAKLSAAGPPASADVANLFRRGKKMIESPKTTVLFSFFAQWFTDGFLRTERTITEVDGKRVLRDTTRNESTHEIDLAQLYGLNREATKQLRGERGELKSQIINGEEYPPFYCHINPLTGKLEPNKKEFGALPAPLDFGRIPEAQQATLFAMGTDTRNIGFITFNVLFLREHNRIARQLVNEYPSWDSDRVFETARMINIVVLLKIAVEEYINHINPTQFGFRLIPGSFPNEPWHRPNWMAIEFNLLYRWHSLVPSKFHLAGRALGLRELLANTKVLTDVGLAALLTAASSQPAGRMCLHNTDTDLVDMAELPSIEQGRAASLASYNDYKRMCRQVPAATFADISSDPDIQAELAALYSTPEDVEFYVGLFAEDLDDDDVLPPLVMTMVAFDAFSHALTNPLLAPRIFNEATFSASGMKIINETKTISDLVHRNVPREPDQRFFVSLTRSDYKGA